MDIAMNDIISVEEVERRLGRNVILFQRLEFTLKQLLSRSFVQGNLAEIPKRIAEREQALKMQTLGNLSGKYIRELYRPASKEEPETSPEDEPEFGFQIYYVGDEDFIEKRKSELDALVEGRNNLIHQHLSSYDENSESSRSELADYLEHQHRQLSIEFALAKKLLSVLHEGFEVSIKALRSQRKTEEDASDVTSTHSRQD